MSINEDHVAMLLHTRSISFIYCKRSSAMQATHCVVALITLFSLLNLCEASYSLVGIDGKIQPASKVSSYLAFHKILSNAPLETTTVVDCTGANDCSFLNQVLGTSLQPNKLGAQLDVTDSNAILYTSFDRIYSSGFCGSKAIDLCCALNGPPANGALCIAASSRELGAALNSYDQVYRRLLRYAYQRRQASKGSGPLEIVIFVEEADHSNSEDAPASHYTDTITAFLQSMWKEDYENVPYEEAVAVKVVLVRTDDPVLQQQARDTWKDISETRFAAGGVKAGDLSGLLERTWSGIPSEPVPLLSKDDRDALYVIESAYSTCAAQAEVGVRQLQTRVARGHTVAKFPARVNTLLSALDRDFDRGVRVRGIGAMRMARERNQRQTMLREQVLTSAGRLYLQQLAIVEFNVLNAFRRELARLIAQDLTADARREQEQLALRKALFSFRTQAAELEDADLGFSLTEARVSEVTSTLETVLREFPESSLAKLEEVRKVERQARSGKAGAAAAGAAGRGRKRKGLLKALGVSLGLVGMLRPPGFGNLQGFIGYATSVFGLPLDLLLGVQNDGDSPEIMGEDREYPILRLQPKIKFDIDLQ